MAGALTSEGWPNGGMKQMETQTPMGQGFVPKLDWSRLEASEFSREQWCADGDGMAVVKRSRTGYTSMDQNGRKAVGRFKTLGAALKALEEYMREKDPGLYEYLLQEHPNCCDEPVP